MGSRDSTSPLSSPSPHLDEKVLALFSTLGKMGESLAGVAVRHERMWKSYREMRPSRAAYSLVVSTSSMRGV
jgi:hypothetical protein